MQLKQLKAYAATHTLQSCQSLACVQMDDEDATAFVLIYDSSNGHWLDLPYRKEVGYLSDFYIDGVSYTSRQITEFVTNHFPAALSVREQPRKETNMQLNEITTEALERELERRKLKEKAPTPLSTPDFSNVVHLANTYMHAVSVNGDPDDDLRGYIFEAVINAIYGSNAWEWINKQLR